MVYLVNGQINLHKSDICGIDFVKYLHNLAASFRLTEHGDIKNMDHYGIIAKEVRVSNLAKRKTANQAAKKGKKISIDAHMQIFDNNPAITAARASIPKRIDTLDNISSLWNMDLCESLTPFTTDQEVGHKDEITVNNVTYNIADMTRAGREDIIDMWQKQNHVDKKDSSGPAGFIFGLQEPYFNEKQRYKMGALEKTGHNLIYDKTAKPPRAALLAAKNLSVFMDTDLSDGDLVIAKYLTGIPEMPEVYIASVYCDITKGVDCIPKNLLKCIKRCQKNNFGFICYGDLNAHSHLWHSKDTNQRGLVFEEELITKFGLMVLNNMASPTYYGPNTTGTIVDVTLASPNMDKYIRNYNQRDAVPSSDHTSLEHVLFLGKPLMEEPKFKFRAAKSGELAAFQSKLETLLEEDFPETADYDIFERKVDYFYKSINEALEATIKKTKAKPFKIKGSAKGDHWWDTKCQQLFDKIKEVRKYMRKVDNIPGFLPQGEEPKYTQMELTELRKTYWDHIKVVSHKAYQKFVETREGSSQMGSFNRKVLKHGNANAAIPLFKRANGTQMTPDETVGTLLDEHFPDCRNEAAQAPFIEARKAKEAKAKYNLANERVKFLTLEKVIASINSFESLKGVGTDELPPLVYKWFGPKAYIWLHKIYKATYLMGLLPRKWLDVRVLFIPKVGKETLCEPRSWRPISLMQYQMKGCEKLLVRENEGVVERPLHFNQHGFRKSRSCISSLSSKIGRIEKALVDHGFALGCYLDIKGAFDHVQNACIIDACKQKGCKETFIGWFSDFLNNRSISFDFKGKEFKRYCAMGTPQGSTASPWFWNAIADQLHEEIDLLNGVDSEGFADDTCFVAIGKNVKKIAKKMQLALNVAMKWAKLHKLEFSASKTKVILFTNKIIHLP